jgi:hypothetical protein
MADGASVVHEGHIRNRRGRLGKPPWNKARSGPYSRRLEAGIASLIDGNTAEGNFARKLQVELTDHVGGSPTITQRLLIDRTVSIMLKIERFEAKIDSGEWTAHDSRTYGGLNNALRLMLRALDGGKPPKARAPSLAEVIARDRAVKES